jgi:hypothetical protein
MRAAALDTGNQHVLPEPPPQNLGVLDTRFAHRSLTRQEHDAALNSVTSSQHTKLTVMPNHALNCEGELEGFVFECAAEDSASVLPISKSSFLTTAIYECLQDNGSSFLELTTNMSATTAKLREMMEHIESRDNETEHLKFDCMPELDASVDSQHTFKDQRVWRENTPAKIGIYHCFMRTTSQNMREHKIFIVVTGYCKHASEELHNMWLDARHDITAGQFMACAELDWLRKATLRHHSRLAARLAQALNLNVRFIEDVNAVDDVCMLLPSTSCVCRDLALVNGRVLVTSDAALIDTCKSGLLFDCYASEGFWVFMGPRDTGSYRMFGNEFQVTGKYQGFPTKTVRYNKLFPPREKTNLVTPYGRQSVGACDTVVQQAVLHTGAAEHNVLYSSPRTSITSFMFPHAGFINVLSQLGFNQNDGIINLMPITAYCDDE